MRGYWQRLKIIVELMSDWLEGWADVTALYLGLNIVSESWLKVFLYQQFAGLLDAKIAGQRIVIVALDQLDLNSLGQKK